METGKRQETPGADTSQGKAGTLGLERGVEEKMNEDLRKER